MPSSRPSSAADSARPLSREIIRNLTGWAQDAFTAGLSTVTLACAVLFLMLAVVAAKYLAQIPPAADYADADAGDRAGGQSAADRDAAVHSTANR